MVKINRYLEERVQKDLGKGKVVIVYGPRQVGKTTLVKAFLEKYQNSVYYNCDLDATRELLDKKNLTHLSSLVNKYELIVIDEAQRVPNIGMVLKILIDNFPEKNFLVTGSSSLELSNSVSEPLTGRFFVHALYPVGLLELAQSKTPVELSETLPERLVFGSYPEVITTKDRFDKQRLIENIASNYLFADILRFGIVRNPENLKKLLQAVALQIGGEASLTELSNTLDIDKNTVKSYLEICEKAFILFSLPPFHTNARKSLSKRKKYYFYDMGIRNALLGNFTALDTRNDRGALWENFIVVERMKHEAAQKHLPRYYFWRSYQKQEIDLIEEVNGKKYGFEFKYSSGNPVSKNLRAIFIEEMGGESLTVVNKENFGDFVI